MATQLLPAGTPAATTGKWVRTEAPPKSPLPMRVSAIGSYSVAGVIIEELVGGQPGRGANSPFGTNVDTGTAVTLGTIPAGGGDLTITEPVAYLRARTDPAMVGTVDYCGVEFAQ